MYSKRFAKLLCTAAASLMICSSAADAIMVDPEKRAEGSFPRYVPKTDYPQRKHREVPDPNVLLILDTGAQMAFSRMGVVPMNDDGRTMEERAALLEYCTYGSGALPYNGITDQNAGHHLGVVDSWSRWGRDIDDSNNIVGMNDKENYYYYSPDPNNPYKLTFKDGRLPAGVTPGTRIRKDSPYYNDLVPNDSRMYIMKLVLWRMTSERNEDVLSRINLAMATPWQGTTSEVTYADFYKTGSFGARDADPENNLPAYPHGTAPGWSLGTPDAYDHLQGGPNYESDPKKPTPRSGNYFESVKTYSGVPMELYHYDPSKAQDLPYWKLVHRAYMRMPFAKLYKSHDGLYTPTNMLGEFRKYIDGAEGDNDPELFADGQSPIATSLYARDYHGNDNMINGHHAVEFGPKSYHFNYIDRNDGAHYGYKVDLKKYDDLGDGLSGVQAFGSAIDFFSPPASVTFSSENAANFPIVGDCQSNWVVLLTAGNKEAKGTFNGKKLRTAAESALELYKQSVNKPLRGRREGTNGSWHEMNFEMQQGIRTMVIGFIPDETKDEAEEVKALREELNRIAAAGQPRRTEGGDIVPDESRKATLANNALALSSALSNAITAIRNESAGSGGPVGSPLIQLGQGGNEREGLAFYPSYKMNPYDQWEASYTAYKITIDNGTIHSEPVWEASKLMRRKGMGRKIFVPRALSYAGDDIELSAYESIATVPLDSDLGKTIYSSTHFAGAQFSTQQFEKIFPYHEMLYKWFYDPILTDPRTKATPLGDLSKSNPIYKIKPLDVTTNQDTRGVGSGDIYIQTNRGFLHKFDAATGEEKWAFTSPVGTDYGRMTSMKFDDNGDWIGGINGELPPVVWDQGGNLISPPFDLKSANNGESVDSPLSVPMIMLDGSVTGRTLKGGWDIDGNLTYDETYDRNPGSLTGIDLETGEIIQSSYGKGHIVITCALGRGGNGLYAMDITNDEQPVMLWCIENNLFEEYEKIGNQRLFGKVQEFNADFRFDFSYWGTDWDELLMNPDIEHPFQRVNYRDMGMTINPMRMFDASFDLNGEPALATVGVLPGGLGWNLGRIPDDKQGKVLYIMDPWRGLILRKFRTKDIENKNSLSKSEMNQVDLNEMGMMVAPPELIMNNGYGEYGDAVSQFYIPDSNGNVFLCSFSERNSAKPDNWTLNTMLRIRTLHDGTRNKTNPFYDEQPRYNAGDPIMIPFGLTRVRSNNDNKFEMMYGATGDLEGPGSGEKRKNVIMNDEQYFFSFRPSWLKEHNKIGATLNEVKSYMIGPEGIGDNKVSRAYFTGLQEDDGYIPEYAPTRTNDKTALGFYLKLLPEDDNFYAEQATVKPFYDAGNLIIATERRAKGSGNPCDESEGGEGTVFFLNAGNGKARDKALHLVDVKVVGITSNAGHVIITFQETAKGGMDRTEAANDANRHIFSKELTTLLISKKPPLREPQLLGVPEIEYWREYDADMLAMYEEIH